MERNCKNCKNQDCFWVGADDDDICDEYLPKTNADKIRTMSDEELAEFLGNTKAFCCRDRDPSEEFTAEFKTWLKQEATDGT